MNLAKYRVWIKNSNCMENVDMICFPLLESEETSIVADGVHYKFDEVELMQWSGLIDRNGTLIYEGDIIRDIETEEVMICRLGEHAFTKVSVYTCRLVRVSMIGFYFEDKKMDKTLTIEGVSSEECFEVIGNIYEDSM